MMCRKKYVLRYRTTFAELSHQGCATQDSVRLVLILEPPFNPTDHGSRILRGFSERRAEVEQVR